MSVPGSRIRNAPPGPHTDLFALDAYLTKFEAQIRAVDGESGAVELDRTAFYPGGGGQPCDIGWLESGDGRIGVSAVKRRGSSVWHQLDTEHELQVGDAVVGQIEWARRHELMRTHTALHILCGVIWADYGIAVTGGNMEPLRGRLDFALPAMSADLGSKVEGRINEEIAKAREIVVDFMPRSSADTDPALIRTAADLIPRHIDPLRVIDIVGLDRQADGGTHVVSTAEVGHVRVVGTESKGRDNKRIRLAIEP